MTTSTSHRNETGPGIRGPEQLDIAVHPSKTRGWVAIIACAVTLAAVIAWSCIATLPQNLTVQGAITTGTPRVQISAPEDGSVVGIATLGGRYLDQGKPLIEFLPANQSKPMIMHMPVSGQVRDLPVLEGSFVTKGTQLAVIAPNPHGKPLYAAGFTTQEQVSQLQVGDIVEVVLDQGGVMVGEIYQLGQVPATETEMAQVLGNDDEASQEYAAADGVPIAVIVALGEQPEWIVPGATEIPAPGTAVTISYETGAPHPINLLFS